MKLRAEREKKSGFEMFHGELPDVVLYLHIVHCYS